MLIYHLLPELEPFSAIRGGALARDVANIMRLNSLHIVVCSEADDTWGLGADRILVTPKMSIYSKIRGKRFLPYWATIATLHRIFEPLLSRLDTGDVVWCHNQLVFSAALSRSIHAQGARLVQHFHDGHTTLAARSAIRTFTPDASIFVSEYLREQWLKVSPTLRNIHVVPNGADENLFYPRPEGILADEFAPTVLYVGRLQPEKGVHVLIDAIRILLKRNIKVACKVVGSALFGGDSITPYVASLMHASPPSIRFEGRKSGRNIAEEYRSATILCCPSVWQEPFGNVTIEAMASGIPVVATRVGGSSEIASGGGVVLVDPGSAVDLANALQKLIENKEHRTRVAEDGLKSFRRRYTWTGVCRQYQNIMESL